MERAKRIAELVSVAGLEAEVMEVVKDGAKRIAIAVGDEAVKPCVYVDEMDGSDADVAFEVIKIANAVEGHRSELDEVAEMVKTFEGVKNILRMGFKYIDAPDDENDLTCEYLGMKVFVYIDLGTGMIKVKQNLIDAWDVDLMKVVACAKRNTFDSLRLITMGEKMTEVMGYEFDDSGDMHIADCGKDGMYGGIALMFPGLFKALAKELNDDLYLIPSSVHEILVVPVADGDKEHFLSLIEETNRTQVDRMERLSNKLFRYNRETNRISIA